MKESKGKLIAYWIVTALLAANYAFAGVMYISRGPDVVKGAAMMGYPVYFMVMLGVWKLLAAVAILAPGTPVIKEWAYAGMFINLTAAAISIIASGMPASESAGALITLVFVIVSWALRPASRRTEKMF